MTPVSCPALVLAAGLGTRLRPLTDVRAKPAIPVAGEPMIRRIIGWLVRNGVDDVVVNLHHLPATLTAVLGDGSDLSARVRYSWEQPIVLGSGGGPRQALDILGADTFLIVNGDTLTDLDVGGLARAHGSSGSMITLALVPNVDPDRYGGVQIDASGAVIGFPRRGPAAKGSFHFIGVQVAKAEAFRSLATGVRADSIGGLYDRMVADRPGSVLGHVCQASFFDVGTASDYWDTSMAIGRREGSGDVWCGRGCQIDPSATVTRSILWNDVYVGSRCVLDACVVADRVRVPPGSRHERAVLVQSADGLRVSPLDRYEQ